MNFLNKKRKYQEFEDQQIQGTEKKDESCLILENFLENHKRRKVNSRHGLKINGEAKITIKLRDLPKIDKGYYNLPKEIIEEAFAYKI